MVLSFFSHGPVGPRLIGHHNLPILPRLCSVFPGSSMHRRREPPGIWTEPSIPNGLKNSAKKSLWGPLPAMPPIFAEA